MLIINLKFKIVLLIIAIIFIGGCIQQTQEVKKKGGIKECNTNSNCIVGGCSGQVCSPKSEGPIITTCEWMEKYACYRLTTCSCINEKCQWKEIPAFLDCLKNK